LTSTYYLIDFNVMRDGYLLPEGVEGDNAKIEAIKEANTTVVGHVMALANLLEGDLFPDAVEGEATAALSPRAP
jgi:hypothetical protein